MASSRPIQLPVLTSMRYVAAMGVVAFHVVPWVGRTDVFARWSASGFTAVGFFFVLSGYILAHTYRDANPRARPSRFYIARLARIYPAYALALLISLPFVAMRVVRSESFGIGLGAALAELGLATTLTQAWVPGLWNAINPPGWSLSVEVFFYLLFPFVIRPVARLQPRQAVLALFVVYAAGLLIVWGTLAAGLAPRGINDIGPAADWVRYAPPMHAFEFLFGMLLRSVVSPGPSQSPWAMVAQVASTVAVAAVLASAGQIPYMMLQGGGLAPLFGVLVLAWAVETPLSRRLSGVTAVTMGEASYSVYILHLIAWVYVRTIARALGITLEPTTMVVLTFGVGITAVAWACHHWVEVPARARILRWFDARFPAPPTATTGAT